jgi:hypothetical protein
MFDGAAAGYTILFMSALLGMVILTAVWLLYACHCFLHVLTESSAGNDMIRWPGESFFEWWWKPVVCVGMLLFWAMVGGLTLAPFFVRGPIGFGIFFGVFVWLAFPVGLFSALHAQNWFSIVHLPLLARLGRHFGAFLFVALLTLPLTALAVGALAGVVLQSFAWVLPTAFLIPVAVLFYARAWGRLAWLILNAAETRAKTPARLPKGVAVDVEDPWAPPKPPEVPEMDVEIDEPPLVDEGEPEWSSRHTPYGIVPEEAARASPAPQAESRRRDEAAPFNEPMGPLSNYYAEQEKRDLERRARAEGVPVEELKNAKKRRPTFRRAFGAGLFLFLFYPYTLRAGLNLVILTLVVLGILCMLIQTAPVLSR